MKKLFSLILVMALVLCGTCAFAADEPGSMPIVETPGEITLTLGVTDHPAIEDWNTNEYVLWLEKTTNINLEFTLIPLEGRLEKLTLILAAGDLPDVFLNVGMTDSLISRYGITEQLFLPLNDLIDEWGIETKKMFEEYPGSEGLITQLDGNIYSLPEVNECYHCTAANKFWINRTWLDNLGLEKPTTLDEFYDMLVAFRDQDANGNGDPNDEIPFSGTFDGGWNSSPDRFILNCFTYYPLNLDKNQSTQHVAFGLYLDEDGETVTVPFYKEELKDGLKYIAMLYDEGLLYPGSFTQNLTQLTQLAESGRLGTTASGYIQFAEIGSDAYRSYTYLEPLEGPNGYQNSVSFPHDSVTNHYYTISADCKYPEEAFRLGDMMYTYEATIRSYLGVPGVDWVEPDEGAVGINSEPALYKAITPWQESEPQNQHVVQCTLSYRNAAFRLGETSDPDVDLYSAEGLETMLYQVTAAYKPYTRDEMVLPPLKFTDEQTDAMSVMKAELNSALKEGMTAFMTGARDVDTEYDAWLADLETKGLSELIGHYQAAYDAQYK